jgi:hypothetical protein
VVRAGGAFIIPARSEEGAGVGAGESRFFRAMSESPSVEWILADARRNGYPPGQQRAFVMAKVLEHHPVIIVGAEHPEIIAAAKMIPAATMDEALALARSYVTPSSDGYEALIVPHALLTLPVVEERSGGSPA